ncbi:MAG: GNAT family N-acetyltransferase [Anaerolineae bacterium]|nr:GNAT family N-acetyltransferase [Anaerolineae bacterium]MCB0200037.1 GNAT family N-acetyltransferase [Anaerolineae bacterium]MCB0206309.1 GNAT family N-acetyltransferase [Anaerolineae bacterium]
MKRRISELTFETSEGLPVEVFRVQPEDAAYLVDLFEHLSTDSRYTRFNQYLAGIDPETVQREAEHIALIDPAVGLAMLAFADLPDQSHAPVAAARYVRTEDPQQAEVSVSVRDDMQHQGIGARMLLSLAAEARRAGICTLIGTFQTSNRRIWALLSESPYQSTTVIDGFHTTVTIDLQSTDRVPA